jgi:hypothetical protein
MCPLCMATVAWIAVGAVTTGGISALAFNTLRGDKTKDQQKATLQGERHG